MKLMLKSLSTFLKIDPFLYLILFVFSVLAELVPLIIGIFIRDMFNALNMSQQQNFFKFAIFFSIITLGKQFVLYQYGMSDAKIIFKTDRFYIFDTLQKIIIFGKKISIGAVMNIFNVDLQEINYQGMSIIDLLSKAIFLVSAIFVMFLNNQLITIIVIIPFIIGNVLLLIGEKKYLSYYGLQRDASLDYFSFLHELIENSKQHRYLDGNGLYKKLEDLNLPTKKIAFKKEIYLQILRSGVIFLNHMTIIVVIIFGWKKQISLGVILMFITYISTAFDFSLLFNTVLNNQSQLKFFEEKFSNIENDITNISKDLSNKTIDTSLNNEIVLKIAHLNFGEILQVKNLDIDQLYMITKNLKENVGFVANEFHLFDETVDNNLRLFTNENISESEIIEALDVSKFPLSKRSLPTIGSNGMKLSAGERQRLAIARALVSGSIIIMNMSFENIDLKTKVEIIKGLKILDKKYIIISDDVLLKKYSDFII